VAAGLCGPSHGQVEIAFGIHALGDSHDSSYYDMVSILLSDSALSSVCHRRLKLERMLCRHAPWTEATDTSSVSDVAARSQASTRIGSVKTIRAMVNDQERNIPILRRLCSERDGSAAASEEPRRPVQSWVQYDPDENDLQDPCFTFSALQLGLAASILPLPALSGRWLLEDDDSDDQRQQKYTLVAYPLTKQPGEQAAPCLVVAVVSEDADKSMRYSQLGVGRGTIAPDGVAKLTLCCFTAGDRAPTRTLMVLSGTGDTLDTRSSKRLRRDRDHEAAKATQPPSDGGGSADGQLSAEIGRLLEAFVPSELSLEQALQAGDTEQVQRLLAANPALRTQNVPVRTNRLLGEAPPVIASAAYGCAVLAAMLIEGEASHVQDDPWVLAAIGAAERLMAIIDSQPGVLDAVCPADHRALGGMHFRGASLLELALAMGHRALAEELVARGHPQSAVTALQMGDAEWLETHPDKWAMSVNTPFPTAFPPKQQGKAWGAPPPPAPRPTNRYARVGTYTMLIAAVRRGDAATVRVLLRQGADVFRQRAGFRSTAINFAQVIRRVPSTA
jgi:hypothetical protein